MRAKLIVVALVLFGLALAGAAEAQQTNCQAGDVICRQYLNPMLGMMDRADAQMKAVLAQARYEFARENARLGYSTPIGVGPLYSGGYNSGYSTGYDPYYNGGSSTAGAIIGGSLYLGGQLARRGAEREQRRAFESEREAVEYDRQRQDIAAERARAEAIARGEGDYQPRTQPADSGQYARPVSTDPDWRPASQPRPKGYRFVFQNLTDHDGVVVVVDERPADLNEDRRFNGDDDLNAGDEASLVFYDGPDHTVRAYWWADAKAPARGTPNGTPFKAMKEKVNLHVNPHREQNDVTVYELTD